MPLFSCFCGPGASSGVPHETVTKAGQALARGRASPMPSLPDRMSTEPSEMEMGLDPMLQAASLHQAALSGDVAAIQELLAAGASLDGEADGDLAPLHAAAQQGHAEAVLVLLDAGANVDGVGPDGCTALHTAVRAGHKEAVQALLGAGASLSVADFEGFHPLHVAASTPGPAVDTLPLLLGAGGSPFSGDKSGATPLHLAAQSGNVAAIAPLLAGGASLSSTDALVRTPLHLAASCGQVEAIQALVAAGAWLNSPAVEGATPLHLAAINGQLAAARELIAVGASLTCGDDSGGTALHAAARTGQLEAMQLLLAAGAGIAAGDEAGRTPLHTAAQAGQVEAVEALLGAGAKLSCADADGATPLHLAVQAGQARATHALLAAGASAQCAALDGATPLHVAAINGDTAAIKTLLAAGASVASVKSKGITALHVAAYQGHVGAVRALLAAGASHAAVDVQGASSLHFAVQSGQVQCVRVLLDAGAHPNPTAADGATPLHVAAINGDVEAIRVLLAAQAGVAGGPKAPKRMLTPLHAAAQSGHAAAIRALVKAGADAGAVDKGGNTPLHGVVQCWEEGRSEEYVEAAKALLDAKADPGVTNKKGESPLALATGAGIPVLQLMFMQAMPFVRTPPKGSESRLQHRAEAMVGQKRGRAEAEGPAMHDPGTEKPRYSKVDADTASYFAEISTHFKSLEDDEERQLIADQALGEAAGMEAKVASDAACSRVLEALLPHASITALGTFVGACVEGENLGATCTSGPFGSHVLEKALKVLGERAGSADEEAYGTIEEVLTKATDAVADNLYDMAVHKYATHVARRLLSVLCGRDVAPAARKQQQQRQQAVGEGEGAQQPPKPSKVGAGAGGLAAKLGTAGAAGEGGVAGAAADWPQLLEKVFTTVLSDDWVEAVGELQKDPFGSPLLQALLRAAACLGIGDTHQKMILRTLGASSADGLTVDALHALMKDRAGSHVMEVVFETAPDDLYQRLSTACFKGHLLDLARHPTANFAVQAGIAALRKPGQLKRIFEDLRPQFASLLRSRRGGIVAAVAGAAGRLGTMEADVAGALWHAVAAAGEESAASPLAALLTLDTLVKLGDGGRLSPLGCAMAATVLRYPPAACRQFVDAVAALPPSQLAAVARDSGGCRVLEAYLEGAGAAPKKRRAMLQALAGSFAAIAAQPAGSYFVEKCYALADIKEKETIAAELAAAESRLATTYRGLTLLRRCNVEVYKKGAGNWQQRVAAADAVRREFEDIFADGAEGAPSGHEGDDESADEGDVEQDADVAAAAEGAEAWAEKRKKKGGEGKEERGVGGGKKKKKKKKEGRQKGEGGGSSGEEAETAAGEQMIKKKKKKKAGHGEGEQGGTAGGKGNAAEANSAAGGGQHPKKMGKKAKLQ